MANFRDVKTLQKFAAAHASIHNHFNQNRHLNRRDTFKQNRAAALADALIDGRDVQELNAKGKAAGEVKAVWRWIKRRL